MKGLPRNRVPEVVAARVCGPFSVFLVFDDGVSKQVNLRRKLKGPIFDLLQDPVEFARLRVDRELGTIAWPNGADNAPETLYLMRAESKQSRHPGTRPRRKKQRKGSSSAA
jgi:hypothetical protein